MPNGKTLMQVFDADYVVVNKKPIVRLFGKTETGGTVCAIYDKFFPYFYVQCPEEKFDSVIAELNLQINHCLISPQRYTLSELKKIYSHPQAIGQCSDFLKRLKNSEVVPSYDTAGSALLSLKNQHEATAAITSIRAAKIYKMKILKRNIQNNKINYTRFLVISRKKSKEEPRHPKSTISFDLKSIPGALHKALGVFANAEINLTAVAIP